MRRKELVARALAAGLAAVQVGSSVSQVAFAAEGIEITAEAEESEEISELDEPAEESDTSSDEEGIEESSASSSEEDIEESGTVADEEGIEESSASSGEEGIEESDVAADEEDIKESDTSSGEEGIEESRGVVDEEGIEESSASSDEEGIEESGAVADEEGIEESSASSDEEGIKESDVAADDEGIEESTAFSNEEGISSKPEKVPQESPAAVMITVVDIFVDEDGNELFRETRTEDEVEEGTEYSYSALEDESLTVIGRSGYSGTATEDTTIEFRYHQEEQIMLAAEVYTATFNINDGSGDSFTVEVEPGDSLEEPDAPAKRDGYIFLGWKRSDTAPNESYESFNSNYWSGSNYDKITKDTTFYAKWVPAVTVTVTDHFYDLEGNEVATITRDEITTCKGMNFTKSNLDSTSWGKELNPYRGENSLTGYLDDTGFWRDTNARASILNPDYDLSDLATEMLMLSGVSSTDAKIEQLAGTPAALPYTYEHYKRVIVHYDESGNETTYTEENKAAIANGQAGSSGLSTNYNVYGDDTIDYYYREIPTYTYEIVDHYGSMADGGFVEDSQQSRGKVSFRSFYLPTLKQKKVALSTETGYELAQIKYNGYKTSSQGIGSYTDSNRGIVVTDRSKLQATVETLTGDDVIYRNGELGDNYSAYADYTYGNMTLDLYYMREQKQYKITVNKHELDSTGNEVGVQTHTH